MPYTLNDSILQHYSRSGLEDRILAALAAAGKDGATLSPDDLAPLDEFHILGPRATRELAHAAAIDDSMHILDVGCGIGGAARRLAREFGCRVTGIDLAEEYCRAAAMLTERTALTHLVTFRQSDALHLPFPDGSFDLVWSQHAAMNIADKEGLYNEMRRVLKPGGTIALYDILAGPGGPVHFPVPWARLPDTNFLVPPEELRRVLEESGFTISSWEDTTDSARKWFARLAVGITRHGLPPLGIHLLLGPEFSVMARNQQRNLDEERIVLARIIGQS